MTSSSTHRPRRRASTALVLFASLASAGALAAGPEQTPQPSGPPLPDDPVLTTLVQQALESRPEIAQARTLLKAERETVSQAGALPDPVLSLGIQNDSFTSLMIGKMETSYVSIMASQTLTWPGKRGRRSSAAGLRASDVESELKRLDLSARAEVESAYVDLLLVRGQLELQAKLETLWRLSEEQASSLYESGEGAQSDILRAQLERGRLTQRRWALEAEERQTLAVLNRLRGRPLDEPIATTRHLSELPDPTPLDVAQATAWAEANSPELSRARLAGDVADKAIELARDEYYPDPTLSAGIMPRGALRPMWQLGVSFPIPVWGASKQSRAVEENTLRRRAADEGVEALRRLLAQRVKERALTLDAVLKANQLYRSGLLVQSETTATSTLTQYRVGKVPFASVLEALAGYLGDVNGFLESVALAQRIAIAERAVSLDPVAGPSGGGMGGSSMGGGGTSAAAASPSSSPSAPAAESSGRTSMSGM